jgi:hypothetical protein
VRHQIIRFNQYVAKMLKRRAYSAATEPPIMPETSQKIGREKNAGV